MKLAHKCLGFGLLAIGIVAPRPARARVPEPWRPLVELIAYRRGVPVLVLAAVVQVESAWNPNARGAAGEIGLGQLMPATASALGITNPWDPAQNLDGAARYLRAMAAIFGSWDAAVAAYNAGPEAVARAGGRPPSEQVAAYVTHVQAAAQTIAGP